MKLFRFVLAIVLAGCGAEPAPPAKVAKTTTRDAGADATRDAASDLGEPIDPAHLAPGMREVVKSEIAIGANGVSGNYSAQVSIPTSAEADVCVRVAVRPTTVRARLLSKGGVLGEGPTIGDKGPVCVRKGDALTVELAADAPTKASVVVWSSP
jgi:hypothetical protein